MNFEKGSYIGHECASSYGSSLLYCINIGKMLTGLKSHDHLKLLRLCIMSKQLSYYSLYLLPHKLKWNFLLCVLCSVIICCLWVGMWNMNFPMTWGMMYLEYLHLYNGSCPRRFTFIALCGGVKRKKRLFVCLRRNYHLISWNSIFIF